MPHVEFRIAPGVRPDFERAGLGTFEALMEGAPGEILADEKGAQVLRFTLPCSTGEEVFYLKRSLRQSPRKNLQAFARLQQPHCDAWREMELVERLRDHGVDVMEIVAWGEARHLGLPKRGFLIAQEVSGESLHDLFRNADPDLRLRVADAFGAFVGGLHAKGFFQIVRLKDLICRERETMALTLIDRAACKPGRKFFWSYFCLRSLKRGIRRMKRDKVVFDRATQHAFATGYLKALQSRWKISPTQLCVKLES